MSGITVWREDKTPGAKVALVAQALPHVFMGARMDGAWMSPGTPLTPIAPPETKGRTWDFPTFVNTQQQPRVGEPIGFAALKALADYDGTRVVIETRKDQLERMTWKLQYRDANKRFDQDARAADPRFKELEDFWAMPDREHTWAKWYRMLLEDLFVTDAVSLYRRPNLGGGLFSLDVMDGATIVRKVDNWGRTPQPPEVAYQQVIKGVVAADYTSDELFYLPHNPRPGKMYGLSPVEQIIVTVNIALRRQLHMLEYYTEGNIPDLILQVPETWQPDQIAAFQVFFDQLTSTADRRKARFVPGGVAPYDTKQKELKEEFDEWLMRVICFCFSISPTPFVKQVNRATAQQQQETAKQEGLEPLLTWTKEMRDLVTWRVFGYTDIESTWADEKEGDPAVKADIESQDLRNGVICRNERRKSLGLPPVPDGDIYLIYTAGGAVLIDDVLNPPEPEPMPAAFGGEAPPESEGKEKDPDAQRIVRVKKKSSPSTATVPRY